MSPLLQTVLIAYLAPALVTGECLDARVPTPMHLYPANCRTAHMYAPGEYIYAMEMRFLTLRITTVKQFRTQTATQYSHK